MNISPLEERSSFRMVKRLRIYARFLLSRHDDRLHTFFHKVHDEVRKMIRGEDSVFAEATRPQLQVVDEERRLKLRRLEYELVRDEAQLHREQLAWQKNFLKTIRCLG